jgi:hypothetical protein
MLEDRCRGPVFFEASTNEYIKTTKPVLAPGGDNNK